MICQPMLCEVNQCVLRNGSLQVPVAGCMHPVCSSVAAVVLAVLVAGFTALCWRLAALLSP